MSRFLPWLVTLLICGCDGPSLAPVSGTVTLDGTPAAGLHVIFQPLSDGRNTNPGGGSYAITDAAGHYSLKMVDGDATGAVIGKHRVEIATKVADDSPHDLRPKGPAGKRIPARYNRQSELTFEVAAGGTDTANFDLQSN